MRMSGLITTKLDFNLKCPDFVGSQPVTNQKECYLFGHACTVYDPLLLLLL